VAFVVDEEFVWLLTLMERDLFFSLFKWPVCVSAGRFAKAFVFNGERMNTETLFCCCGLPYNMFHLTGWCLAGRLARSPLTIFVLLFNSVTEAWPENSEKISSTPVRVHFLIPA
jgi:hypothetical protein